MALKLKQSAIDEVAHLEEYVKKKKEKERQQAAGVTDIAPVTTTTTDEDEDIAPVNTERTWFQKSGVFDDGYQFGDVTRAILGTGWDISENLITGVVGMGEKAVDALATLAPAMYASQMAQSTNSYSFDFEEYRRQQQDVAEFVGKDLYDEEEVAKKILFGREDNDTNSVLGEKSDSLVQSSGQLGATIGLSAAGVPWYLTTGITSYGSEAENALSQGADLDEAMMSGLVTAGAEILSEKISGGISFGGKSLTDLATKNLAGNISNKTLRTLTKWGIDASTEGFEEIFSGYASAIGQKLTYMDEAEINELFASEDKWESFLGGFVLGGAGGGVSIAKDVASGVDPVSGLTKNEQAVIDKELQNRIAEKEEQTGKKITAREKSKLYDEVVRDMDKGRISIDTIEEVLGGDTFTSLNDSIKNEDALLQEFTTLNQMKTGEMTGEQLDRRNELKQQLEELKNSGQLDQLRGKLREEVIGKVQGDRLLESYREKDRLKEFFTADLNQYDAKMQETVKRAIDSGVLNNTRRSHELVELVAKIEADKGVVFNFTDNEKLKNSGFAIDGKTINGYVNKDGVTINVNSAKELNKIVGHEITHVLEGTEMYSALHDVITEYAKTKGEYQGRYDALAKVYESVENADIEAELTADLVGDYLFSDPDFINHLSVTDRNVFQKIWDEVKYLCKVATAGSKEARELEKVKKAFEQAYKSQGKAESNAEGTQYSLTGKTKDGIEVYETSPDVMKLTWDERKAKYLDVIKNEYKGRTAKFIRNGHAYYAQFDQSSIRKPIYGDNRASKSGVKALIKAGADGDVFDLVENSNYNGSAPNTKNHTDADYFDYFVKTVQIDGKVFDLMADVEKKYYTDGGYVYTLALVENKKTEASSTHGTSKMEPVKGVDNASNGNIPQQGENVNTQYSLSVTDQDTIDFLENQEHITTYKAMQVIDGKLYPPMAAKVKDENGKYQLTNPSILGQWQQATEDTKNIKKVKNGVGYYTLNKGDGTSIDAAYNPYEHSSNLVLNDQFESAHRRDNLVVVECEIPVSEMSSGYKAEYAKDATGVMDWHSGVVAGKIKGNKRQVYLSRYLKPVRILSDAEVAAKYKEILDGTGVSVPFNVVQPSLLSELEKAGVAIDYDGSPMYKSIQRRAAEKNGVQYSLSDSDGKQLTPDIRYSLSEYAPPFYSQMTKVINGVKQGKLGANSVVSMLRGKGVKAEEIKWSGIETFLEGKKSVTKQELLYYIRENDVQIETETLDNKDIPYTEEQTAKIAEYTEKHHAIMDTIAAEWERIVKTEFPYLRDANIDPDGVEQALRTTAATRAGNTAEGKKHADLILQIKSMIEANDNFGFDGKGQPYRSIVWNPENFIANFDVSESDAELIREFARSKQTMEEMRASTAVSEQDAHKLKSLARDAMSWSRKIMDVKSEYYAENAARKSKWGQYRLDGGNNYREYLFKMPDSDYSNQAMASHWGDERSGVLAHARVQDMKAADGGNVLFVEEIQSDWHNEGAKEGYADDATKGYAQLALGDYQMQDNGIPIAEITDAYGNVYAYIMQTDKYYVVDYANGSHFDNFLTEDAAMDGLKAQAQYDAGTPDAPFRKTYHEFVLKNLLREAAENGYDYVAWTPGWMQEERWSSEYAEGYRIEYDQDIPKFLNKYGKQWGAHTEDIALGGLANVSVHAIPVTDSMKRSVLYEGQPKYSLSEPGYAPKFRDRKQFYGDEVAIQKDIAPVRAGDNVKIAYEAQPVRDIAPEMQTEPEGFAPISEEQANDMRVDNMQSLMDEEAPPEVDAPMYDDTPVTADDPFENRDFKGVGNRKVKAYMYENPEVKPFFQQEAQVMLGDLNGSIKGERWYNDKLHYETNGELGFSGTKRYTSDDIAYLLDECGYTYEQIEKGLKAIIEDDGKENNACSKRIEFLLNDRLRDGYTDFSTGYEIPPNQDYINLLDEKQVTEYNAERLASLVDADAPPLDDIAPVRKTEEPPKPAAPKEAAPQKATESEKEAAKIAKVLDEAPNTESGRKRRAWAKFKAAVIDKGAVFEDLSIKTKNRELIAKWNYILSSEARAQRLIGNGNNKVKSLNAIREEVGSKAKLFSEYMYHQLNIDRMSLDTTENAAIRAALREQFKGMNDKQIANIASEWITKDVSAEQKTRIKAARQYVEANQTHNKPVFGDTVTADVSRKQVQEYEKLYPQFKQYAQDVYDYMSYLRQEMVDNGVVSQETADLWAKIYPHYVPIRRVDHVGQAVDVPLDTNRTGVNAPIKRATGGNSNILPLFDTMGQRTMQTYKAIAKNGFGIELMNTLGSVVDRQSANMNQVVDSVEAQEGLLQEGVDGDLPTFTVFDGGERVTFEITEDMYEALKPTEGFFTGTNKLLNNISNFRRGLLTEYNPVFLLTNAIKDVQDVLLNSQHPVKTYLKVPEAIAQMASNGYWYREYLDNVGEQRAYYDFESDSFERKPGIGEKITNTLPLRTISTLNNYIERLPRLAEYIASREAGASVEVAVLDAARVTTNFAAGGYVTKWANRNGATFLNASVQGAMQQVRNVREAHANGIKGYLGLAAKFAAVGIPALILDKLVWGDDEEYEELSDYVKQNYYIVGKTEDGTFIRIPKGRASAVFQDALIQTINAATGDDEVDLASFIDLAKENLMPNNPLKENIFSPITQTIQGKTWYGEDMIPQRLQDVPAAEQYDESTDAISKWLGDKLDISPIKINYLLDQYSGGVGDLFLPMMTAEAENGYTGAAKLAAPFLDKFTTNSVKNNQNVGDFYDMKDELARNANSQYATDEDILMSKYMNSKNSEMSELYKERREIQNSNLPDDQKYQAVREVQEQINAIARESLNDYSSVKVTGDYAEIGDRYYRRNNSGEWTKITDDQLVKQREVTSGLGISPAKYWSDKEEYDYAYESPDKYAVAKSVGGYEAWKNYSSELNDIYADKDENGKSISGSRKEKVIDWINELDADYGTKIILFKSEYNADDTYNEDIIDYLNSRDDLTYEERKAILLELDFKVSEDGTISWD